MKILGINALNHDAAVSVLDDGEIKFAAHSERYSRKKNDYLLNDDIGCPMVLNTSLNIKGQPIVNTRQDGKDFEKYYGVKVL